jgi:hypothetical protein
MIFVNQFQRLLKNTTFLFILIAKCLQAFQANGMITFFPKMVTVLTGIPSTTAPVVSGSIYYLKKIV